MDLGKTLDEALDEAELIMRGAMTDEQYARYLALAGLARDARLHVGVLAKQIEVLERQRMGASRDYHGRLDEMIAFKHGLESKSARSSGILERAKTAATAEIQGHLAAGREVHGRRDGKPIVIKPKKEAD